MGGNEYGESGPLWPLIYIHSFEALNDAFEVQLFSGLHFYTLPKTLIPLRTMQLRFFLSEKLLNTAFKVCVPCFFFFFFFHRHECNFNM